MLAALPAEALTDIIAESKKSLAPIWCDNCGDCWNCDQWGNFPSGFIYREPASASVPFGRIGVKGARHRARLNPTLMWTKEGAPHGTYVEGLAVTTTEDVLSIVREILAEREGNS